jgi:hypothetical protein
MDERRRSGTKARYGSILGTSHPRWPTSTSISIALEAGEGYVAQVGHCQYSSFHRYVKQLTETAAHLVDHVFPEVPVRHRVLSLLWQLALKFLSFILHGAGRHRFCLSQHNEPGLSAHRRTWNALFTLLARSRPRFRTPRWNAGLRQKTRSGGLETNHRDAGWSRFNRSGATVLQRLGHPKQRDARVVPAN